jgi:hypothetical protein
LKLMKAAAEKSSIGFEENKMAVLRNCTNEMRDAGMKQGLASPDPHDRRTAAENIANLFVRNGVAGIGMQNFRCVDESDGMRARRETQFVRDAGQDEVRSKPQGEAHHAL